MTGMRWVSLSSKPGREGTLAYVHGGVLVCFWSSLSDNDLTFSAAQAQEGEALLCLTAGSSTHLGEAPEPSETSRDTARSSDLRLVRPCQPAHTRTKHHSGSNVSFSHDTEGGEDDQNQVRTVSEPSKVCR